jgi:hypothetical protein
MCVSQFTPQVLSHIHNPSHVVKSYLRRNGYIIHQDLDPEQALLEACSCITADMCKGWFTHTGYIF